MLARRVRPLLQRAFATKHIDDTLKEKGRGDEEAYFSRKDRESLRRLLNKIEDTAAEPEDLRQVHERQRERLLVLLKSHSLRLSEVVIEDLLKWKRGEL